MALYPSLEDMKVDEMAHAQIRAEGGQVPGGSHPPQYPVDQGAKPSPYASIMSEVNEYEGTAYGGLDISQAALSTNMQVDHVQSWLTQAYKPVAAITAPTDQGVLKAMVKQGVRKVQLSKDGKGKLGVAVDAWDKGVFVAFVWANSAASLGGLRFGDQILQIDGVDVAGWSQKQVLSTLKKANPQRVELAIRDRPFMRTITCQKDATNHVGFLFKNGEVVSIVKESSAARNGMMIHHQVIEVNAQCVVGLTDKELLEIFRQAPMTITLTITPKFVYKHLISKIGFSTLKKYMNHAVPEF